MAARWLRYIRSEICPNFSVSNYKYRRNQCCTLSRLRSTATLEGEAADKVDNKSEVHRKEKSKHACASSSSVSEYKIPHAENSSLLEYVKKIEKTIAQGKGTILKSWSRVFRQPKNPNLNVSVGLKSGSLQCFGLTTNLLEERLNFLAQIDIKGKDALIIAVEFPAILSWDSPNFTKILKILTDFNCDIVRLMCRSPFVFGLDYARVTENIHKLSSAGVTDVVIGKLVTLHPLILSFPLRDDNLALIKLLLDCHEKLKFDDVLVEDVNEEEAVLNLLLQSFEKSQEQVNLQEKFNRVISFLHEMQVSPLIIAAKNPMIFNTNIDTLCNAVEFFTSKPLLLEMEVIQQLLTSRSEIFVNFDAEAMQNRVQLVYDVVQSPTALYNLILAQSNFVFEKSDTKMEDIIQWFQDIGIEDKEMRDLVTFKNFFLLDKKELTERVNYLLTVCGVTMDSIKKNPSCLLKPLSHLRERVEFLKAEKPDVLTNHDLGQIMTTKNKEFASEICGSSLEHFSQFIESMNKNENETK